MRLSRITAVLASIAIAAGGLLLAAPPASAYVTCAVDKASVNLGESVTVTLNVNKPNAGTLTVNSTWIEFDGQRIDGSSAVITPTATGTANVQCWANVTVSFNQIVTRDDSSTATVTVNAATPTVADCAYSLGGARPNATGFDLVRQDITAQWKATNATEVGVEWYLDGTLAGTTTSQTASSATLKVDPSRNDRSVYAVLTPKNGTVSGTSLTCPTYTLPGILPDPPKDFSIRVQTDGSVTADAENPDNTGIPSLAWASQNTSLSVFTQSLSPSTVKCPATGPVNFTLTLTPKPEFAAAGYATVTLGPKPITPKCTSISLNKLLGSPAYDQKGKLLVGDTAVVATGVGNLKSSGLGATAEFVDWAGRTLSSPFDFTQPVPTAAIPAGTEARCVTQVRASQPIGGLVINAAPLAGPYSDAADRAYCSSQYPAASSTSSSSTPVPPGGSTAAAPTTSPSAAPSGTAAKPASTGGGGASSASTGSSTTSNGGAGAAAGVRVFTSKCLADEGLYSDMAGSVGSSFVMAPDLRDRPIPASFAVTSGALPAGIKLDSAAGVVYGVPTQTDAGATPITITATNPDGSTTASTFSFPVDDPHHSVSYPVRVVAGLNEPVDVFHHGKGNSGPTSYSLVCGTMPEGLSLDAKTGVISGIPTVQVQYPIPLRIRQKDGHGWVDASMMLLVDNTVNPWLTYPHHVTVATGTTRTIRPTVVGLPEATYELIGTLPRGMTLDPSTGAITGKAKTVSKKPAEVSVLAVLPDGSVAASDTLLITARKRAIPMSVTAAKSSTQLKAGKSTTVVTKVKHTKNSKLKAKVTCTDCTHTFNRKTGKLTVRPGGKTTTVEVTVTARPVGKRMKARYRHHVWSRTWNVG